jgi:hypothetical protein
MRKKAIGILVVSGALVVSVAVPAAQSQTYVQPPTITPITGKIKLKKKIPVATIHCGTGSCSVIASTAKVKGFTASFVPIGTIGSGGNVTAKVKVPKAAKDAILAAGKGKVKWNLTVHSSAGPTVTGSGKRKIFVP